ncbi:aurora kinase A and ninein-interacting protein [Astyanax mexicanus]|uniref:aurora kinase A and ninein-interacting protein n=1 Tax=Astyanax mexicanus TaxID=7994 RepID=UPI0020CB21E1|nr:aurora kinase A and ninein-interacting protein [Astyanax mexicanus]
MKGSKAGKFPAAAAPEEECGVWLDAAELRTKKQKKRLSKPISKLLNPLARSGGYSMAVALNFTQTKMEMPATKQSTISAFFQPRSKMTKDTEECSPYPSESSSILYPEVHMGNKRKRVVITESPLEPDNKETSHTSQVRPQDCEEDLQSESDENVTDQTKEQDFFHLIWGYESEELEPAEKRRPTEDDYTESEAEMQTRKKAVFHGIQDIPETLLHSELHSEQVHIDSHEDYKNSIRAQQQIKDKNISSQKPVLTTRSVTDNFGEYIVKHPHKALELPKQKHQHHNHHHHTQWSPVKRKDKENCRPTSPKHTTACSPLKILTTSSPAKSIFQKARRNQSPKKSIKESLESEQDSIAMLFTQDSEGFRVIANRSKQTRCPLKDRTNSTENRENWNLPSGKSLETEDSDSEPEMLFTQDSQGNMVIKH